jgi:hypothetical protein
VSSDQLTWLTVTTAVLYLLVYISAGLTQLENRGAVPDIEVVLPPHASRLEGTAKDTQLERGVAQALEMLQQTPDGNRVPANIGCVHRTTANKCRARMRACVDSWALPAITLRTGVLLLAAWMGWSVVVMLYCGMDGRSFA